MWKSWGMIDLPMRCRRFFHLGPDRMHHNTTTHNDRPSQLPLHSIEWLLENRQAIVLNRARSFQRAGYGRDTPTAAIYRMYDCIVADATLELRNEIEYFFNQNRWPVADIPDSKDPGPAR